MDVNGFIDHREHGASVVLLSHFLQSYDVIDAPIWGMR